MAARAKKHIFLAVFRKRGKNDGFLALEALFLRFCQNKKNWNSNLDHLEQLLLNRFCSKMKLIFFTFYSKCGFRNMHIIKAFLGKMKNVNTKHVL